MNTISSYISCKAKKLSSNDLLLNCSSFEKDIQYNKMLNDCSLGKYVSFVSLESQC